MAKVGQSARTTWTWGFLYFTVLKKTVHWGELDESRIIYQMPFKQMLMHVCQCGVQKRQNVLENEGGDQDKRAKRYPSSKSSVKLQEENTPTPVCVSQNIFLLWHDIK